MNKNLAQEAINHALKGEWVQAIQVNKGLLEDNPKDTEALNRLAKAYSEVGNIKKAIITAKKVIKINQFDVIARKSIEKWKNLKKGDSYKTPPVEPQLFIEEPGKTKIVSLIYIGNPNVLATLDSGDRVKLDTHSHRSVINTKDGKYIGRLPDDLSARLKRLIKYGNEYSVCIKSVNKKEVKVFIREIKRGKNLSGVQSFPPEKINYISYTPPELIHKENEGLAFEEEE